MKRTTLLTAAAAVALCLVLASCGPSSGYGDDDDSSSSSSGSSSDTTAAATADAPAPTGASVALTVVGDEGEAADIAQEAFVRAWRRAGAYDPRRGAVHTWLLTITRNLALDHLRRRGARPVDHVDPVTLVSTSPAFGPEAVATSPPSPSSTPTGRCGAPDASRDATHLDPTPRCRARHRAVTTRGPDHALRRPRALASSFASGRGIWATAPLERPQRRDVALRSPAPVRPCLYGNRRT